MRPRQGVVSAELRWSRATKRQATGGQGLHRFLATTSGLPRVVGAASPKEEALRLIRIAAEVEHTLMVEYLYSAFTIAPNADPTYQRTLTTIAKQEMGHLMSVQNLLRLLGAPPHLDRDDLLPGSGKGPGPFALAPATPESIARYVVIESPLDEVIKANPDDWAIYQHARSKLDASTIAHINRVGALYIVIYWLFMKTDTPEPSEPWVLDPEAILHTNPTLKGQHLREEDFADPGSLLAIPDEWDVNTDTIFVEPTRDRQSAKIALAKIAAQGEGINQSPTIHSHFERFLSLFANAENHPPEVIAVPVASAKSIKAEAGQRIAELFNLRYQSLLLVIDLALRTPPGDDGIRASAAAQAIDEMLSGIKGLAVGMLGLTGDPTSGPVAPPFELPGGKWPNNSLETEGDVINVLKRLVSRSEKLNQEISTKWPDLLPAEVGMVRRLTQQISDLIAKIPSV